MSKQYPKALKTEWVALSAGAKAAVIVSSFIVIVGGVSFSTYLNRQNQQTLILARQQEKERPAVEQVETERIAAEEQAMLEQGAQTEAVRLPAEEEQTGPEAETERITAEEAAAAEQARQAETAQQQTVGFQDHQDTGGHSESPSSPAEPGASKDDSTGHGNTVEPASGEGYSLAQIHNAVWVQELGGWVFQLEESKTVALIHSNGLMEYLVDEQESTGLRYLK